MECELPARQYHNLSERACEQLLELLPGAVVAVGSDDGENVIGSVVSAESLPHRRVRARLRLQENDSDAAEVARLVNEGQTFFGLDMTGRVRRGKPEDWPDAPEQEQRRLVHVHEVTKVRVMAYDGSSEPRYTPPFEPEDDE